MVWIEHFHRMVREREHRIGPGEYTPMAKVYAVEESNGEIHASILFFGTSLAAKSAGCISISFTNGMAPSTV